MFEMEGGGRAGVCAQDYMKSDSVRFHLVVVICFHQITLQKYVQKH